MTYSHPALSVSACSPFIILPIDPFKYVGDWRHHGLAVEEEDHLSLLKVEQRTKHVSWLPTGVLVSLGARSVPDQLPAAVVGNTELIVPDTVAFLVQELAVLGCPADLRYTTEVAFIMCHVQTTVTRTLL